MTDAEQTEACLDLVLSLVRPKRSRGEGAKNKRLRLDIMKVLDLFEGTMSSRQVFYQLVTIGAVENTKSECGRVGRLLVKMRREGVVPYYRIVDRTRSKHVRSSWDGVADIMQASAECFKRDYWNNQTIVPMIACEKQALEGIFEEAVDEYGVPLFVLRGYNSESFEYEWSEEIKGITRTGRQVAIAYFGDWDPSGLDIERSSREKLEEFGAAFVWVRSGLLQDDFDRYKLVNVPVKTTDTRAKSFLSKFGERAAELDALRPDELRRRIQEFIERFINADSWISVLETEEVERESLAMVANNWEAAVAAARSAA